MRDEINKVDRTRFFTNDKIVIGGQTCERISYPSNIRLESQSKFDTPYHTIGSKSLLVYLDGKLKIPEIDYVDRTSTYIEFKTMINKEQSVDILLIVTGGDSPIIDGGIIWEDF